MSSLTIAAIVLACIFSGSLFGMWLSYRLPENHRSPESRDAVKLATGMLSVLAALVLGLYRSPESRDAVKLATGMLSVLAALVLGLLIASVKNSFDSTDAQIREFAATLILLNQTLADYGPETVEARQMVRRYTARALEDNWPEEGSTPVRMEDVKSGALLDGVRTAILALPGGDKRREALRADAASLVE